MEHDKQEDSEINCWSDWLAEWRMEGRRQISCRSRSATLSTNSCCSHVQITVLNNCDPKHLIINPSAFFFRHNTPYPPPSSFPQHVTRSKVAAPVTLTSCWLDRSLHPGLGTSAWPHLRARCEMWEASLARCRHLNLPIATWAAIFNVWSDSKDNGDGGCLRELSLRKLWPEYNLKTVSWSFLSPYLYI